MVKDILALAKLSLGTAETKVAVATNKARSWEKRRILRVVLSAVYV
jgi:hypothetical protein